MTNDLRPRTIAFASILEMGSERVVADLAVNVLEEHPERFGDLLELCWLDEYPISMRAARAVQLYCEKYPEDIFPYLNEVVVKTLIANITGVRRNFLKIFADHIDIHRISDPGPLLNTCFDWLLDGSNPPALKIYAMTIIFKLGKDEPDLLKELAASIEIIMPEGEISLKTCGRKMLQRISRQMTVRR
jgi:hypothetical protein